MSRADGQLAGALARGVILDEGFARELAEIADVLRRDGHQACADGMLRLCHHHRIRAMESRGNLAALSDCKGMGADRGGSHTGD